MKNLIFILLFYSTITFSQIIDKNVITTATNNKLKYLNKTEFKIDSISEISGKDNNLLLFKVDLLPQGFILFQSDYYLDPILSYSFENKLDTIVLYFYKIDAQYRKDNILEANESKKFQNFQKWNLLLFADNKRIENYYFEQWPPEGTTTTGGWLTQNWTQSSPYNDMCPYDVAANAPSYAGCPAVAAGMIIDFNRKLNSTTFTDEDDYQHNYGGNNFKIDDDFETYQFPSFDSLNQILTDIQAIYDLGNKLTDYEKAALIFACGTAATQVYNSQGSGTFSVSQAFELYQKFGFENSQLYTELSEPVYQKLIDNMKNALPSHLAIVDESWTYGHNVVVDGYNTDNFFHINFGWGGSSNNWWNIPDPDFPYSMSVLEGIIIDINYEEPQVNIETSNSEIFIFPNPGNGFISIQNNYFTELKKIEVYNLNGELVLNDSLAKNSIDISDEVAGIYFVKLIYNEKTVTQKYLLVK